MKISIPEDGDDIVSQSVLNREALASRAGVQHILLAWKELVDVYGTRMDPRAAKRSFSEARAEVRAIVEELEANHGDWKRLLQKHSEDPIAAGGKMYDVFPKARLSRPFKEFSLRLEVNEVAVINTRFGFHIIRRME